MKKELFAAITILLLLVAAGSNVVHLTNTVADITAHIDRAAHAVDMGDYAYAVGELNTAHSIWDSSDTQTHTLLRHADIDTIMESFHDATAAAGQSDYYAAKYTMETLRSRLQTLIDMERVSLHSVF